MAEILLNFPGMNANNSGQRPNRNSFEEIRNILLSHTKYVQTGISPLQQLQIKEKDREDMTQIKYLLCRILKYPSQQIAQLHKDCFRLGKQDLFEYGQQFSQSQSTKNQLNKQFQLCPCCGFIKQEQTIETCTQLDDIKNIGVSTYLYFLTLKVLIALLLILFFVFGIFSLVTNIIASGKYQPKQDINFLKSNQGFLVLSLGSKQLNSQIQQNKDFYIIQCWIGLGVLVLWSICLMIFKYKSITSKLQILTSSKSAADYSVIIHNISMDITQKQLQKQLNQYLEGQKQSNNANYFQQHLNKFQIKKFNIAKPFYLDDSELINDQIKQLTKEYEKLRKQFVKWVQRRMRGEDFDKNKQEREELYKRFIDIEQQRDRMYSQLAEKIKKQYMDNQDQQATTSAFITFQSSYAVKILLSTKYEGISDIIAHAFTCCWGKARFFVKDSQGYETQAFIQHAPQPQDIIWTNLGQSKAELIKRKLITFLVTIILLGIAFAIVYGLSRAQVQNQDNFYLSILISVIISIFNVIITQILRILTYLQRNYTQTSRQASFGFKAVLALLINSIFTPIMVNYYIKSNLYGVNGLAYDVFLLAITNSLLSPLLKIFDGYFFFTRIYAYWINKPKNRLGSDQEQVNQINELIEFQVGYQYVYLVSLFIFTAFFASLQPIIPIFAVIGLLIMYWAQKYSIFNRCRRPIPGSNIVNQTMFQLITFGCLLFALGNFTWSHFFPDGQPTQALIPNIISCSYAGLLMLLPFKQFIKKLCISNQFQPQQFYSQNRIFLPSQYDRLNPLTSKKAIKQYMEYVDQYKQKLKNKTPEQIKRIEKMFLNQINTSPYQQANNNLFGNIGNIGNIGNRMYNSHRMQQRVVNGLLGNGNNMNPFLVLNTVVPEGMANRSLNIAVQNWGNDRHMNQKNSDNPLIKFTQERDINPQENSHQNFGQNLVNNFGNIFGNQQYPFNAYQQHPFTMNKMQETDENFVNHKRNNYY